MGVTYLHKIVKSLTKNNFNIRLHSEIHSHRTRQSNDSHCPNKHPALKQSTVEYNRFCSDLRHLTCIETFKSKLKLEIMKDCDNEYNVISPYRAFRKKVTSFSIHFFYYENYYTYERSHAISEHYLFICHTKIIIFVSLLR